jgi:hypothetical protein
MTDITMALMELLRKHELDIDNDFLRKGVQIMMQMLIELEAGQQISLPYGSLTSKCIYCIFLPTSWYYQPVGNNKFMEESDFNEHREYAESCLCSLA